MSPPPAGRRSAWARLGDALRRRLTPDRGAPPGTVPGLGSGEETALAATARTEPAVGDGDAEVGGASAEGEPAAAVAGASAEAAAAEANAAARSGLAAAPEPDADMRIDAARDRLRARIEPPDPDD